MYLDVTITSSILVSLSTVFVPRSIFSLFFSHSRPANWFLSKRMRAGKGSPTAPNLITCYLESNCYPRDKTHLIKHEAFRVLIKHLLPASEPCHINTFIAETLEPCLYLDKPPFYSLPWTICPKGSSGTF